MSAILSVAILTTTVLFFLLTLPHTEGALDRIPPWRFVLALAFVFCVMGTWGIFCKFLTTYFANFAPIETEKCVAIIPLLAQLEVAEYCRKVAAQGRLLTNAEFKAILANEEDRLYKLTKEEHQQACKKVYDLT